MQAIAPASGAAARVSVSDLAHEQIDLRVDRQVLQLAGVARQLHQQAAEGDEHVHAHLRAPPGRTQLLALECALLSSTLPYPTLRQHAYSSISTHACSLLSTLQAACTADCSSYSGVSTLQDQGPST